MKRRRRQYAAETPPYIHSPCNSHVYSYARTHTHTVLTSLMQPTPELTILLNMQAECASKLNPSEHASITRKQTLSFRTRKQNTQANSILPKAETCAVTPTPRYTLLLYARHPP